MGIYNLSQIDELADADQMPVYSASGGGDRRAPLSLLTSYIREALGLDAIPLETQYSAPNATGFTATIAPTTAGGSVWLLMTPVAGYAAGTIALPAKTSLVDKQEFLVSCTQAVTTLTVSSSGTTINGAPTTLAANGFFKLRYDGVLGSLYRVG